MPCNDKQDAMLVQVHDAPTRHPHHPDILRINYDLDRDLENNDKCTSVNSDCMSHFVIENGCWEQRGHMPIALRVKSALVIDFL